MALNRTEGEVIEGLGHIFRVASTEKWATTDFGAPHFNEAWDAATLNFRKEVNKFCNPGDRDKFRRTDILVQEYPMAKAPDGSLIQPDRIAYIFEQMIDGTNKCHVHVFDLDPRLVEALILSGDWTRQIN